MKNLCIISEGRTECDFVTNVLASHLLQFGWLVRPTTLITGQNRVGVHKGGWHSSSGYQSAIKQICNTIITEKDAEVYTTFFDLYGFPIDIPCYKELGSLPTPYAKAKLYENQIKKDVIERMTCNYGFNIEKFVPYIQPYEFECFLFVDPYCSAFELVNDEAGDIKFNTLKNSIEKISSQFETPEHINQDPNTAPSKRIEKLVPGFVKHKAGRYGFSWRIAQETGVESIRRSCLHFNEWLTFLETY